jgi:hypothetical protein
MLVIWLKQWGATFLDELYGLDEPPEPGPCRCDGILPPSISCSDCLSTSSVCLECTLRDHRLIPTHRVRQWITDQWQSVTLQELGLVLPLGNHASPCKLEKSIPLTVGDINGLHTVMIAPCGCRNAPAIAVQLLRARIFPCSEDRPSSGFTFALLKQFGLAAADAKVAAKAFFGVVQRQTNNVFPHRGTDRYREFLRVSRAWMFLQDQKRAGNPGKDISTTSDVSLPCPACPRLNINYEASDVVQGDE